MITKALLQVSLDGLGPNHETSIFPCGIFQYMKGVNDKPGTPNYDLKRLALESLTKRIYPNFANNNWSGNVSSIEYDRKIKEEVINELSDEEKQKLIEIITDNPAIGKYLYLNVIEE